MDYNAFCELVKERCELCIEDDHIRTSDINKKAYVTAKFDWAKEGVNNPHMDKVYSIMEQLYPTFNWTWGLEDVDGDYAIMQLWTKALEVEIHGGALT